MGGLNKNRNRNPVTVNGLEALYGAYRPPSREECEEDPPRYLPQSSHPRIKTVGRTWRQAGRLVDFYLAVQYQNSSGEWLDHMSIDCSHGHAHQHHYVDGERDGNQPDSIMILNTVADVQKALKLSMARIMPTVHDLAVRLDAGGREA